MQCNYRSACETKRVAPGRSGMDKPYMPADPTLIEGEKPAAIDYWSKTLEVRPERLKEALRKAGPLLEDVKRELGIGGGE
jgi:hypothetical protein